MKKEIMKYAVLTIIMFIFYGCGATSIKNNKARLYTDQEAELFKENLSQLIYPTSIEKACQLLGIDKSRLNLIQGYGKPGRNSTNLSKNYNISFLYKVPDGGFSYPETKDNYYKVDIYKSTILEKD